MFDEVFEGNVEECLRFLDDVAVPFDFCSQQSPCHLAKVKKIPIAKTLAGRQHRVEVYVSQAHAVLPQNQVIKLDVVSNKFCFDPEYCFKATSNFLLRYSVQIRLHQGHVNSLPLPDGKRDAVEHRIPRIFVAGLGVQSACLCGLYHLTQFIQFCPCATSPVLGPRRILFFPHELPLWKWQKANQRPESILLQDGNGSIRLIDKLCFRIPAFHIAKRCRRELKLTAASTEGVTPPSQLAPNLSEIARCGFLQNSFESPV